MGGFGLYSRWARRHAGAGGSRGEAVVGAARVVLGLPLGELFWRNFSLACGHVLLTAKHGQPRPVSVLLTSPMRGLRMALVP